MAEDKKNKKPQPAKASMAKKPDAKKASSTTTKKK